MSLLLNADGSLKTYAVVDTEAKIIVAAFNYVGEAVKGMKALEAEGAQNLALHNVTHAMCPDWLEAIVKSDRAYCSRRAQDFDARAASLRRQAMKLVCEAEDWETRATVWRERAEASPAPNGPGM